MRRSMTPAFWVLVAGGCVVAAGIARADDDGWPVGRANGCADEGQSRVPLPVEDGGGGGYLAIVTVAGRDEGVVPVRLRVSPSVEVDATPVESEATRRVLVHRPVLREVVSEAAVARPPAARVFWLLARAGDPSSPANYERRNGRLRAVGERVQVYVDEADLNDVADSTLRDLVAAFDETIWPRSARLFGPAADVDGDERLTVFFSRLVGQVSASGEPVDGYVRSADFDMRLSPPLGNQCDLLCLNPRLEAGPHLRTVVAHEYAHGVIFSRRVLDADPPGSGQDEEAWLDEGLAHLVEDLFGFSRTNVEHRVRAYRAEPSRYSVVVEDY